MPDEVTATLGLAPSRSWRTGDLINERMGRRRSTGEWCLSSGLGLDAPLEEHVDAVLRQLRPCWPRLVDLCTRYEAGLNCVVKSYGGDRPALPFDKEVVRRCAELGAWIDVDLYVFD
jgi:hypothetical protein